MKITDFCWKTALCAVAFGVSAAANAHTIGFDSLAGGNGSTYSGHSEGGFTITPVAGDWREAHLLGNPIPDIFGASDTGTVRVTGGTFTFASVDLADGSNATGTADWEIHGFLGVAEVLTMSGSNLASSGFTSISSNNPSATLDRLEITILRDQASTYNMDNIVARAVPLPGTLALLALGLAGIGFNKRKTA